MKENKTKYAQRGVSAGKEEVYRAIRHLDKGLYPNAFCKILPDLAGGEDDYCNVMHADTAGTKPALAYLYWKETGDLGVWAGIARDAIVMNIDDMACAGITDRIILSSTIGRNKNHIPGEVLEALIGGTAAFLKQLSKLGVQVELAGGETADVGDIVRTVDVGITAFARWPREKVVRNEIQVGDVIVGLGSSGKCNYETEYNSGIGSNGLTSARHDMLHYDYYLRYPESMDPAMPEKLAYCGKHHLTDAPGDLPLNVGKALLSPTRSYLPVLKPLLGKLGKQIHGLIHCTGGAQTKVLKFADKLHIIKDNLFPVPPLFRMIQESSGTDWREMYQVFNMGHRLEVYLPETHAGAVIKQAKAFDIEARVIGRCEAAESTKLTIKGENGSYHYTP